MVLISHTKPSLANHGLLPRAPCCGPLEPAACAPGLRRGPGAALLTRLHIRSTHPLLSPLSLGTGYRQKSSIRIYELRTSFSRSKILETCRSGTVLFNPTSNVAIESGNYYNVSRIFRHARRLFCCVDRNVSEPSVECRQPV